MAIKLTIFNKLVTLFLLPLSCMVVPIGNIVNKLSLSSTFSSSTMSNSQEFVLPTMLSSNCIGMDISIGFVPVNSFEVRGRTSSTEKNFFRDSSISLTQSSIIYHERIANNDMNIDQEPTVESLAMSYEMDQEKALCLSKVTEASGNMRPLLWQPLDTMSNDLTNE